MTRTGTLHRGSDRKPGSYGRVRPTTRRSSRHGGQNSEFAPVGLKTHLTEANRSNVEVR